MHLLIASISWWPFPSVPIPAGATYREHDWKARSFREETLQLLPPAALMNELLESVMTHNLTIHLKTGKSTTRLTKKKSFQLTFTCIITNKL